MSSTILSSLWLVSTFIWLHINCAPPHWDMASHLTLSLKYYDKLHASNPLTVIMSLLTSYQKDAWYPPVVYLFTTAFYFFFGTGENIAVLSNVIWIFLLLFSIISISRKYFSRIISISIALFTFNIPFFIIQSHIFMLDLPLTAVFIFSVWLMLQSRNFTERKYCVALGFVIGMGMLVKWTYLFFVVAVMLSFVLVRAKKYLTNMETAKSTLINIALMLLFAGIICIPWYYLNRASLADGIVIYGFQFPKKEGEPLAWNTERLTWYLKSFWNVQIYPYYSIPILLGIILVIINKKHELYSYLFTFLFVYMTFTIILNKDPRYTLPLIPLLSLFSGYLISLFTVTKWRILFHRMLPLLMCGLFIFFSFFSLAAPNKNDWKIKTIVNDIHKLGTLDKKKIVFCGNDFIYFNYFNIQYYFLLYHLKIEISDDWKEASNHDLLLIHYTEEKEKKQILDNISSRPLLLKNYFLPDYSSAQLYLLRKE